MTPEPTLPATDQGAANDTQSIPREEEEMLRKVLKHLDEVRARIPKAETYDNELVALRDQIGEARLEDVPALLAQMERVAGISAQRSELQASLVDPRSPYFARLRLREKDATNTREREVLIGRATYIDSASAIRIVDWRHAPVSQLYYRYAEGDEYEEKFGDREVEGQVLSRRTLTISASKILRIGSPQGTFVRNEDGSYRVIANREARLEGGQGKATRPSDASVRGVLGVGPGGEQRLDRHLPEISALLDPRQFELISRPDAGLVVIQGGAGSGKTTIGLHRLAYLNYQAPKRFAGDRMMVMTTTEGLVAYTSEVLPALGVSGVHVTTFPKWAAHMRKIHFPWLSRVPVTEDTTSAVSRLKKHPAVLRLIEQRGLEARESPKRRSDPTTPVAIWSEVLTDLDALRKAITESDAQGISEAELRMAWRWCSERCPAVAEVTPFEPHARHEDRTEAPRSEDEDVRGDVGIDGAPTDSDLVQLDPEDEALLLRAHQAARGPLRKGKDRLEYEHLFVDEAQDFSVAELAVLLETTTTRQSITLAGDVSQRLVLDNSFRSWEGLFEDLGIRGVAVEPLRIAYRSTREVLELARDVLGPLASALPPDAPRTGAPVEMFMVPNAGVAVGLLGEALRALALREPRATIAVLARYSEQADLYYDGLKRAEVPNLRRVRSFDFSFRPGVEVTEIRQVKGLEYDYVILVDVNASAYPTDDESRHLMHVAATRAAHQLWVVTTGDPSAVLPQWLVDEAL
ncbi:MAG: ATP-binding domain-containing protein [Deltaproteobacteria bacterium]|nr:ATP-binding domain-containing protein [Deltaproteobacteria bacterium]